MKTILTYKGLEDKVYLSETNGKTGRSRSINDIQNITHMFNDIVIKRFVQDKKIKSSGGDEYEITIKKIKPTFGGRYGDAGNLGAFTGEAGFKM